jgi:hypothetical protein
MVKDFSPKAVSHLIETAAALALKEWIMRTSPKNPRTVGIDTVCVFIVYPFITLLKAIILISLCAFLSTRPMPSFTSGKPWFMKGCLKTILNMCIEFRHFFGEVSGRRIGAFDTIDTRHYPGSP